MSRQEILDILEKSKEQGIRNILALRGGISRSLVLSHFLSSPLFSHFFDVLLSLLLHYNTIIRSASKCEELVAGE
jgi:hypothetical protein